MVPPATQYECNLNTIKRQQPATRFNQKSREAVRPKMKMMGSEHLGPGRYDNEPLSKKISFHFNIEDKWMG
jgi:hypothetical protein